MADHVVCRLEDLEEGTATRFDIDGHRLAVVRVGGDVYVIGDRCSHQDVSLSLGTVDEDECTLECIKHGSTFDLRTGEPTTLPATRPVPVYGARVVDGEVVVSLS